MGERLITWLWSGTTPKAQEMAEPEGFCSPAIPGLPFLESDLRIRQLATEISGP